MIVGLGNPGRRYAATLHNAGFRAVERIGEEAGTGWRAAGPVLLGTARMEGRRVLLAKPQTYMNLSGAAVAPLFRRYCGDPGDMLVVHDDLDLPPGTVRLKRGGGTGGHNGLRSIREEVGTADFLRVRVGVGRPPPGADPAEYVLAPPDALHRKAFEGSVRAACEAAWDIARLGFDRAMTCWNAKARTPRPDSPAGNILLAPGGKSGGLKSRKEARPHDDTEEV